MFTVTDAAQKQVAEYFSHNDLKPVRIFLAQGCGGAQMAMALDEKRDDDMTFKVADVTYLVEKTFLEEAQPIEVDFAGNGFKITSSLQLESGCSSCGSCGS